MLNQDHPQKKWFFWSNPYKIEIIISTLLQMLELPNCGHITTSTTQFESRLKIFVDDLREINYGVIVFILKYFYFKKG